MEKGEPQIDLVSSGMWMSETDQGGYYCVGTVGIWMEIRVQKAHSLAGTVGVRWTVDGWKGHHDTLGVCMHQEVGEALWRVEIPHLVSMGWRDGSIGGPNGEQPSAKVWILWGPDRGSVRCLPWGRPIPAFELALFMKTADTTYWSNNQGQNFRVELTPYGKKMEIGAKEKGA